jgi:hypothetical protein
MCLPVSSPRLDGTPSEPGAGRENCYVCNASSEGRKQEETQGLHSSDLPPVFGPLLKLVWTFLDPAPVLGPVIMSETEPAMA